MAFTIYLRNSKQRVYSMEAAINLASMLLAQDIKVVRIEGPDDQTFDAQAIRKMCEARYGVSAGR